MGLSRPKVISPHALSLPPQRHFYIRQFERPRKNINISDNAAACAFACATTTFVSGKFWASAPAPHRSLAQNLLLTSAAVAQAKAHAAALSATLKFSSRALILTKEQMSLWLQRKCVRRRWRCWRRISLAADPNATSSTTLSRLPQQHFVFGEFQRR